MRSDDPFHDDSPAPPADRRHRPGGAGASGRSARRAADKAGANRGVVQSVDSGQIVLRALDGGVVTFGVSPRHAVRLNGARATLADVRPGFVARVMHDARARALLIQAFGAPAPTIDRGIVTAVSRSSITLRTAAGATVTVGARCAARTSASTARRPGASSSRPGAQVAVTHAADAPATVVNVLKRAGA